jgi:hypothetical protein
VVVLWQYPFLALILFWWAKPAGSRLVLFELSRRLFGEEPTWKSVWREIPRVWWRRFFYRFLWARFSPMSPLRLPVEELEGLRGKPYRQRCGQIARRGGGAALWTFFISEVMAIWLGIGIFGLLFMLLPEGQDSAWKSAIESWDSDLPLEIPLLISRTLAACMMVGMSLTDVFVIGAGFGIYINNRTWIEGWDVELAFKRLAYRLGKVSLVALSFLMLCLTTHATETPAEAIKRIKADPVFVVHTVTERVPKTLPTPPRPGFFPAELMAVLMQVFGICVVVLLVGLIGWIVWKYRHVFLLRGGRALEKPSLPAARVVMGMGAVAARAASRSAGAAVPWLYFPGHRAGAGGNPRVRHRG